MPDSFSGGCACGAVRYECSAAPVAMVNCYCRDCQRASGGAGASAVVVSAEAFTLVRGQPKGYDVAGESGTMVRRIFCDACGSPLFSENAALPAFKAIKVASLDDPSWFKPMANVWVASAQPWAVVDPAVPSFPKNRPRPGGA